MAPPAPIKSENCVDGDTNGGYNNNSVRNSSSNNSAANLTNLRATTTGAVPKQAAVRVRSLSAMLKEQIQREERQQLNGQEEEQEQPTREHDALKTLSDLLLSTVAQRARLSNGHDEQRAPAAANNVDSCSSSSSRKRNQQQQRESLRQQNADHNYDSSDNLQEQQQRYCFPVRPVQRVQHQQTQSAAAPRLRQATPPNATIGVVIPNTTNGSEEQAQAPHTALQTLVHRLLGSVRHDTQATREQVEVLRTLLDLDENWNSRSEQTASNLVEQLNNNMVHEINPGASEQQGIVNSVSLEDVALSEMSDDRAQSIQSLHSAMDTPTPDATPSFDELQQRLDASNRNMQQLQDEQNKLLQIQNMAKTHLNEMEQLRQQAGRLSGGDDAPPNYANVQQVQDDMASLVGRMKTLTTFIHNQNELSSVLGDDGPEILAEQQALQEKLEALRGQREDMRNLVDELNSINRTAKETAQTVRTKLDAQEQEEEEQAASGSERVVPVLYERKVPILRKEAANAAQRALHAQDMINQKTADIEALKSQMARLKSMLHTVSAIEESTPSAGKALECNEVKSLERELPAVYSNEVAQRVHALNDVTTELRAEATSLQKERERILALKAEIERRKQQAAAAVQMGEEALQRSSLTPTPTPMRQQRSITPPPPPPPPPQLASRDELRAQCERLRAQYEQKQREYDQRCKTAPTPSRQHYENTNTSEADDERNDDTDSGRYFAHVRTSSAATLKRAPSASTVVEKQQQQHRRGNSKQSTTLEELTTTIDTLSLGNDSLQSSSTRSQYMPPPMAHVHGNWSAQDAANLWQTKQFYAPEFAPPAATATASSNASTATQQTQAPQAAAAGSAGGTDSVLLQQFMQTQQMLINSVCQCNQTLWHQQREIDHINGQLQALQQRVVTANEQQFGLRSESVPPANLPSVGNMPNNLCLSSNRAQSEQLFGFGAHSSAFSNYQQHQRSDAASYGVYQSVLNNATVPSVAAAASVVPPPPPTHFNNETPISPHVYRASPGPIFMNHHNNTIHQNNANLRTQNQHVNNLQAPPEPTAPQPTLNNQVPPGNRANNYWDNFRSHTRQNLLSINSSKSNEELDLEHQQYRQMQRLRARGGYDHYPHVPHGAARSMQLQQQRRHFYESTLQTSNSNNLNNNGDGSSREWGDERHDDDNVDEEENNDNIMYGGRRRNRRRQLPTLRDADANAEAEQTLASNLHNMNVNYGNSPLYQRNKVPAKPSTSAVALTPLQQRQLRFDFELPQHQQQQNFDYVSPFGLPPPPPPPSVPPVYNLTVQEAGDVDESNALETADETASEELNRNLLVNALKNDKFTTKFYESIKEDVYRRLETLFEQQQQQQQLSLRTGTETGRELPPNLAKDCQPSEMWNNPLQQQQSEQQQQIYNEMNGHSLRKALNAQAAEQVEDEEDHQQQQGATAETYPEALSVENTESGTETPLQIQVQVQLENDKPEDENTTTAASTEAALDLQAAAPTEEQLIVTLIAAPAQDIEVAPDHELIEYIIKRIRNQTHNNTIINDSLLAEVSKLTATAAQNSAAHWVPHVAACTAPLISPKRIYAKIKKMDIPRQRDEFLHWYRAYLEQLFVVEQQPSGSSKCKDKTEKLTVKKQLNERVRAQSQSQDSNDADLAEADQKVSSNGAKSEIECENNENPEEEAAAAAAANSLE